MKIINTLSWLITSLFVYSAMAQAPQSFNYQAVARNEILQPYPNQSVSLLMSILQDSPSGSAIYVESHEVTTNEIGLFDLQIGKGIPVSGDFASIDWSSGSYFLQTEMDVEGGIDYELFGTNQLLSVPYALYAENSPAGQTNLILEGNQLSISGGNSVDLPILSSFWQASGSDIFYNRGKALLGTPGSIPALQLSPVNLNIWGPDSLVSSYTAGFLGLFNNQTSGKLELGFNKFRYWNRAGRLVASIDGESGGFASFFQDSLRASIGRNEMGTGSIATYGTGGQLNFLVDYANNRPDAGLIGTFSGGDFRTVATVTSDDAGVLATFGPAGTRNLLLANSSARADAGSIELYDRGGLIVEMGPDPNNAGFVTTYGPDSTTNVDLISLPGSPKVGAVTTFSDGRLRTILSTNADDAGLLETNGPANLPNISLTSSTANADAGAISINDNGDKKVELIGETIGEIGLFGANGSENVILSANLLNNDAGIIGVFSPTGTRNVVLTMVNNHPEAGAISTYENGQVKALISTTRGGNAGAMATFGKDSSLLVKITADATNSKVGGIETYGENDSAIVVISSEVSNTNTGAIEVYGENGSANVVIASGANHSTGAIELLGENENLIVEMLASNLNDNTGDIVTYGANGSRNVLISGTVSDFRNGSIDVFDGNNSAQAGIFVDQSGAGVVWGDMKTFRVADKLNPEKDIIYASLEGPEAAAYLRGTSRLTSGEATISFPPHFQQIGDFRTMTVMLTPLSAESKGIAVIEKNATGFSIRELFEGQGNYDFDWEVKCIRNGFQDFQVIQDKLSIKKSTKPRKLKN